MFKFVARLMLALFVISVFLPSLTMAQTPSLVPTNVIYGEGGVTLSSAMGILMDERGLPTDQVIQYPVPLEFFMTPDDPLRFFLFVTDGQPDQLLINVGTVYLPMFDLMMLPEFNGELYVVDTDGRLLYADYVNRDTLIPAMEAYKEVTQPHMGLRPVSGLQANEFFDGFMVSSWGYCEVGPSNRPDHCSYTPILVDNVLGLVVVDERYVYLVADAARLEVDDTPLEKRVFIWVSGEIFNMNWSWLENLPIHYFMEDPASTDYPDDYANAVLASFPFDRWDSGREN